MGATNLRQSPIRPTVATVDLRAIANNFRAVRQVIGPSVGVIAVIKADAYGHGAFPVARLLEGLGVWGFGVATAEEGVQLRESGVRVPVLVMGAAFGSDHSQLIARDLTPVVGDVGDVERFAAAAQRMGRPRYGIHVKVDTGMTRLGVTPPEFARFIRTCARYPWIRVDGLATHLACAEEPLPDPTEQQLGLFQQCLEQARSLGADPQVVHAANSAAALRFPQARFDLVRVGIALYGALPGPDMTDPGLQPALSWSTQINALREVPAGTAVSYGGTFVTDRPARIATLPVGYADGYPRRVGGRAEVLLLDRQGRPHRAPVIGRVCMDLCMVDVTGVEGVCVGDTVYLIGGRGGHAIHPDELARWAETITYEIWVGISKRVPRRYPGLDAAELGLAPQRSV